MRVISKKRLREFWDKHADAEKPLKAWYTLMKKGQFDDPHALKTTFSTVDFVGEGRAVFNIGGNKYRLIVHVRYEWKKVFVVDVLTHDEYDKVDVTEL